MFKELASEACRREDTDGEGYEEDEDDSFQSILTWKLSPSYQQTPRSLGHVHPSSTAVYLTITDDLLQQASQRFERFALPAAEEAAP